MRKWCSNVRNNMQNNCVCNIWIVMPSISTCIISQLTALQRDCLICVNSIPQLCRTLQRSKCQDGGMSKIKERAYVESNGGALTHKNNRCHYVFFSTIESSVCIETCSGWHLILCLIGQDEKASYTCCCSQTWDLLCAYVCSVVLNLPLGAHILLLDGNTRDPPNPDAHLDVSELQTKIFSQDGHPGSTLTWPSLWE